MKIEDNSTLPPLYQFVLLQIAIADSSTSDEYKTDEKWHYGARYIEKGGYVYDIPTLNGKQNHYGNYKVIAWLPLPELEFKKEKTEK